jgi:hypothetical protein
MQTYELIQIIGALLNMGAFALLHFEIAPSSALRYLTPNWLGSVLLVVSAYADRQWGFLMLEVPGYCLPATRSPCGWPGGSRVPLCIDVCAGNCRQPSRCCWCVNLSQEEPTLKSPAFAISRSSWRSRFRRTSKLHGRDLAKWNPLIYCVRGIETVGEWVAAVLADRETSASTTAGALAAG